MKRYILSTVFLVLFYSNSVFGQSPNNDFTSAISISSSTTRTDEIKASDDSELGLATSCGYDPSSKGVWYKIPSSVYANVEVNTCSDKSLDTKLHVYKGTSIGSLTCITENDDTSCEYNCGSPPCINLTVSKVTFTKNAGKDYYILLTGYAGETGAFTIKFIIDHIAAAPKTFHVSTSPNGAKDGSNWSNTMSLQSALETAQPHDKIWVKAGTYKPTKDKNDNTSSGTSRTFVMRKGVTIYGGFTTAGNPTFADRNWINNPTILSGDMGANDNVTTTPSSISYSNTSDNINRIVNNENNGLDQTAILDGFTLKGSLESGVNNIASSPLIRNCIIKECSYRAVYNQNSSPKYINCTFNKNGGNKEGGALFFTNCADVKVTNCLFSSNYGSSGGAIHQHNTNLTITNCTFSRNYASSGGVIHTNSSGSPSLTLKNSIFYGNTSSDGNNFKLYNTAAATFCLFEESSASVVSSNMTDLGNNIFGQDPLFEDANNGKLRLKPLSPAINKGNNAFNSESTDLEGNTRIYGNRIDMGAYENPSPDIEIKKGVTLINSLGTLFFTATSVTETQKHTLTIKNTGTGSLIFTGTKLEIEGSEFTSAVAFTTTSVAPSTSITLDIQFNPSDLGVRTGVLKLYSNDTDESPYIINLKGWGNTSNQDSLALIELHKKAPPQNSSTGLPWTTAANISTWKGVTIKNGRVSQLDLAGATLRGVLPPELGNLTAIERLDLSNNELSGSIPSSLSGNFLTKLKYLDLSANSFTGSIPAQIGSISTLEKLNLSNNQLEGSIPDKIIDLDKLEILRLNNNNLKGTIPNKFTTATDASFKEIDLSSNFLDGNIPSTLGGVRSLEILRLNNNRFIGGFTNDFFKNNSLEILDLSDNKLEGNLPKVTSGNLNSLAELYLHGNKFKGNIPKYIVSETIKPENLVQLVINDNQLSGSIPKELNQLTALTNIEMQNNKLEGDVPDLTALNQLRLLYLYNNELTGDLSKINVSNLERVKIQNNQFDGIPDFSSSSNLINLQVENNQLTFKSLASNRSKLTSYSPQAKVYTEFMTVISFGDNFTTTTYLQETKNKYLWYKDDVPFISGAVASFKSAGVYYAEITNSDFPDLTLTRHKVIVKMNSTIPIHQQDSAALVKLYNETNGDHWDKKNNWVTKGKPVSQWYGVRVKGNRVTEINLQGNKLDATTLPSELGNLTALEKLDLSNNKLSGSIPTFLGGNLTKLKYLDLSANTFISSIPPQIGFISALEKLNLSNNQLQKGIPDKLTSLDNLVELRLNDNRLDAGFTADFYAANSLKILDLSNNKLEGNLPKATSGNVNSLTELYLYGNKFKGNIPKYIVSETIKPENLVQLVINDNQLSGSIPKELNQLTALTNIEMQNNKLEGDVPDLTALNQLRLLYLYNNELTGDLSKINVSNLERVKIQNNQFDGIPDFSSSSNLINLQVENNQLTFASIIPNISKLTSYKPQAKVYTEFMTVIPFGDSLTISTKLSHDKNKYLWYRNDVPFTSGAGLSFTSIDFSSAGVYHAEIRNPNLPDLVLTRHKITVKIDSNYSIPIHQQDSAALVKLYNETNGKSWNEKNNWVTNGKPVSQWYGIEVIGNRVTEINLQGNKLDGTLPIELGNLTSLQKLNLSGNKLTSIPTQIGSLIALKELKISGSDISKNIPKEIGNISKLEQLDLSNNQLTGSIPKEIGNISKLEQLDLSNNQLTKSIPEEIGSILNLKLLNLSNNQLEDLIPEEIGSILNLKLLNLSNNQLEKSIPDKIIDLDKLEILRLNNNNLKGTIPNKFTTATDASFKEIDLSSNFLDGNIPSTLGGVRSLEILRLNDNRFTGGFTNDFFKNNSLEILDLSNNQLKQELPKVPNHSGSSNNLGNLVELYLHENQFTGKIPKYIISDTNKPQNLTYLTLNSNRLSGNIPDGLNDLKLLTNLQIQENKLDGDLPNLGNLTNIKVFYANHNQLTGNPTSLASMSNLERVKLQNNNFDSLPNFSRNSNLINLQVENNHLDFGDLEDANSSKLTTYHPQKKVLNEYSHFISAGDNLFLTTGIRGNNNKYQWYKGKDKLSGKTEPTLKITNVTPASSGIYYAEITSSNSELELLTITRNNITVQVSNATFNTQDYDALMAFFTATGGINWLNKGTNNWGNKMQWGNWKGVTVNSATGRVTAIRLPDNNLRGYLPPELKKLTKLEVLDIQNNYVSKEIPKEIGFLTVLKELYLQENDFTGEVPKELGKLSHIQRILLNDNKLSGSLPNDLQFLSSSLKTLHLHNNHFKGTIPSEWTNLVELRELYLHNNQIEGTVPLDFATVAKMPKLRKLRLQSNLLTDLPDFSKKLERLEVQDNLLTFEDLEPNAFISSFTYAPQAPVLDTLRLEKLYGDTITLETKIAGSANAYTWYKDSETNMLSSTSNTHTFQGLKFTDRGIYWATIKNSKLPKLTLYRSPLFLDVNDPKTNIQDSLVLVAIYDKTQGKKWTIKWDFTKPVYKWKGVQLDKGRVIEVDLNNANLVGKFPKEIGQLPMLKRLYLEGNHLDGKLPDSLWTNLDSLVEVNLKNNEFTGEIPKHITTLVQLERLNLSGNQFEGEFPKEFKALEKLYYLNLSNNHLAGELPEEIGRLIELTYLSLHDNNFEKTLPSTLGNLTYLQELDLANNRFTGAIPKSLGELRLLETLKLNNNRLSDQIPAELGKLNTLAILDLHSNNLKQNIPANLGQLTRLQELYLHSNNLSGTIPSELGKLNELVRLNLSQNQFTGEIPPTFNQLTQIKALILEDNQLEGKIPDLSSLKVLEELSLANNNLTGSIPNYFTTLARLKKLEIQSNNFTNLPDFSKQLDVLSVKNNRFLFSDLTPNRTISKFTYKPQADLDKEQTIKVKWGDKLELSVTHAGGSKTSYHWEKNGTNIKTDPTSASLVIYPVNYSDAGEYLCKIQNTLLPDLTLSRKRIRVEVLPPNVQISDIEVLQKIYNATNGDRWKTNTNWKKEDNSFDTTNVKKWYGVTIENDRVIELNLQNNLLGGELPNDIRFLTKLKILRLSGNDLTGTIPIGVNYLKKVTELDLSNNKLEGKLPPEIGQMTSLVKLNLQGNQFKENSQIPKDLSQLSQLQELNLSNNQFGGSLPNEFSQMGKLSKLILNNNNLDKLPDLSALSNLSELQVQNNYLTFKYLVPNNFVKTYRSKPQKKTTKRSFTAKQGTSITLSLDAEVLEGSNQYRWRKKTDNQDILSKEATYTIQSPSPDHTGDYECEVTNPKINENLMLTYDVSLQVTPSVPQIITPKPYCAADTLVTLIAEGVENDDTNWYADEKLTQFLGKGKKLRLSVPQAHCTIYAIIQSADNKSKTVAVPIIRRPVIELNANQLKTDTGANLMYQWQKDNKILDGENTETLTTQSDGTYQVTVITKEGCSASSAVYQLQNGQLKQMNQEALLTSVEKEAIFQTSIYPNPFTKRIEVRFAQNYPKKIQVQLVDINGKIYLQKSMIGNAGFILKAPELTKGVYFLHLKMGEQKIVRKIIKE